MTRTLSYAAALREAQDICLSRYPEVILMGLGVPDPKGVFGSTLGLQEAHGADRVFDIPLSENAMTGVALGAAIAGSRPILTYQRVDFTLVAIEQIVNQAAKWHYMFGGAMSAPLVLRMIIGRGWGQGPQHSQSLQAWFAHVPGLKVIMPATAADAKGMLIAAVEDDNPIVCLEHRWLYGIDDVVPEGYYRTEIGSAKVRREGKDVTLVAASYMTLEALRAAEVLESLGVEAEVIDLRSVRPLDTATILASVEKTGRVVIADTGHRLFGVSAEVSALITEQAFGSLQAAPARAGLPDYPTPTSPALAADYYPTYQTLASLALRSLGREVPSADLAVDNAASHDQPDPSFTGPF